MHPFTRTALCAAATALTTLSAQAVTLVGITSANEVVRFDTNPAVAESRVAITGLAAAGERLVGIDTRPSNGMIYGVSTASKLYTLDEMTGAASFVADLNNPVVSAAKGYGIDFNPVADYNGGTSLRLVSSTGDNYAINANNGGVTVATSIAAGYSGVAYSNSMVKMPPAPASTTLYYLNSGSDMLAKATTGFNNPTITQVGSLGVDVLKANGFEVLGNGMAFAALTVDDASLSTGIFSIDLMTGAATMLRPYNGTLSGLTVSAVPEPTSVALLLAGLAGVGFIARRRSTH